ncbi:hypothetical protein NT04LM_3933, partial [Listeria monocytogenes FSL F2-208]
PAISSLSASVNSKSNIAKFCAILSGFTDLAKTIISCSTSQRKIT